jgi:hypothetical protein
MYNTKACLDPSCFFASTAQYHKLRESTQLANRQTVPNRLQILSNLKLDNKINQVLAATSKSIVNCCEKRKATVWSPHNWVNAPQHMMRLANACIKTLCKSAHEEEHKELVAILQKAEDCNDELCPARTHVRTRLACTDCECNV